MHRQIFQDVSIPFGAIKRVYSLSADVLMKMFQFHLVRLKDYLSSNAGSFEKAFQFHLVRLKGYRK